MEMKPQNCEPGVPACPACTRYTITQRRIIAPHIAIVRKKLRGFWIVRFSGDMIMIPVPDGERIYNNSNAAVYRINERKLGS
jgi:hypothetical protein